MRNCRFFVILLTIFIAVSCGTSSDKRVKPGTMEKGSSESLAAPVYKSPRSDTSFFSLLNLDYPGMEEVKKNAEGGEFAKAKEAYLVFRRIKSTAKWSINPADKPSAAKSKSFPDAEHILKHIVKASIGAPETYLGEDINWNFHPLDSTLPNYSKEWTWQNLNRMRQWTTLGEAYWATLDEKYAKEWVSQMTDWVKDNPVPLNAEAGATMAWRTIESGIRMAGSWMNSYYYFLNSPSFTPEAHKVFVTGVIEHAQRLEKITLEHPERSTNWVAMECNGLGTIGVLFPELKMSEEIRKVAFDRLYSEMESQVYPDGAQTELAPGYHQVSRNNFMALANIARDNNVEIPAGYFDRIKKMYEYNLYLMDPSGYLPPFNDSRRVDATPTLREAYEIWKDPEFLFGATLGREGKYPEMDSYYFNWAGYYVMRSGWNHNDNCLYFDAGPVGFAHEHEDMLNLYLYSRGKVLLTEPGNYSYDLSEWRRYALSTRSHNTIIVDGKEQHRREFNECRKVREPIKNPWITTSVFDYGRGIYDKGYQATKYMAVQGRPREYTGARDTSITHIRHVIFFKPYYYLAVDFLEGEGRHRYDAHFHLDAPGARIDEESKAIHTLRTDSVQLALFPVDREGMDVSIVSGQEDPILGWLPSEKRAIPTVVFTRNAEAPAVFSTLLFPYYQTEPKAGFKIIMTDNSNLWAREISTPYEDIVTVIKRKEDNKVLDVKSEITDAFSCDASVIVVRQPKDKKEKQFGFYGITQFKGSKLSFTIQKSCSVTLITEGDGKIMLYNPQAEEIYMRFIIPARKKVMVPPKKWISITPSGFEVIDNNKSSK